LAATARLEEQEVWLEIWRTFLSELNERQQLKWSESFMDGSFAPAKKGATESEKPSGVRGRSGWWWSTARVFLWETTFTLHSPAEVKLVEKTLAAIRVRRRHRAGRPRQKPERMIMDRGYDSDGLRRQLVDWASNRSSRIVKVGANRRCKTVEPCGVTKGAGSSSARSPGWATSGG